MNCMRNEAAPAHKFIYINDYFCISFSSHLNDLSSLIHSSIHLWISFNSVMRTVDVFLYRDGVVVGSGGNNGTRYLASEFVVGDSHAPTTIWRSMNEPAPVGSFLRSPAFPTAVVLLLWEQKWWWLFRCSGSSSQLSLRGQNSPIERRRTLGPTKLMTCARHVTRFRCSSDPELSTSPCSFRHERFKETKKSFLHRR